MKTRSKLKIGFIGQGYIGKNYADDFKRRGFAVVRYALEEPYLKNKDLIKDCEIVFIAVPTPTTARGFDSSIVEKAISLVGKGHIAVIKSTVLPGTVERFARRFSDRFILFSPEFLSKATASYDAAHPFINIVGVPKNAAAYKRKAAEVLKILPLAPHQMITTSTEGELIKYAHNTLGYSKVVYMNILYELGEALGARFEKVREALAVDPMVAPYHLDPVHKTGRGAGGLCFIKDFAAFRGFFEGKVKNKKSLAFLRCLEAKNLSLLEESNKDLEIIRDVYGNKRRKK